MQRHIYTTIKRAWILPCRSYSGYLNAAWYYAPRGIVHVLLWRRRIRGSCTALSASTLFLFFLFETAWLMWNAAVLGSTLPLRIWHKHYSKIFIVFSYPVGNAEISFLNIQRSFISLPWQLFLPYHVLNKHA